MDGIPIGLALLAGALAVVNPCGFALLPVYASILVLGDSPPDRRVAVGRAVGFAAAMTLGFAVVFGVFGLLLASVAGPIQDNLPWFTIVLGAVLAVLGGWLLAGRTIPGPKISTTRGPKLSRSVTSMTFFGAAYALASLGCTIGPFLVTVVATFRATSFIGGAAVFAAYALGMGLIVAMVSVGVALARSSMLGVLRRAGPLVSRLGGLLMLLAGGYVAYYGWYEIRVLRGGDASDPVINAAAGVQRRLASAVESLGVLGAALVLVSLIVIALLVHRFRRTRV